MQDFIPRGTGNSRTLKSVSTFLNDYPTYEAFAAALMAGTLPVDLGGPNAAGYSQLGTALNTANLLSSDTAGYFAANRGATPATVNQGLYQAARWIRDVESQLTGGLQMACGTYTGTGVYGSSNTHNSVTFDFEPQVMFIHRQVRGGISSTPHTAFMTLWGDQTSYTVWGYGQATYPTGYVTRSGNTVTWYHDSGTNHQMNTNSWLYDYVAFG